MPDLSEGIWIFPQLERSNGFKELRDSVLWADKEARVVVVFQDDDQTRQECIRMMPVHWRYYTMSADVSTAQKINYAVSLYPDEKFYGLLANDIVIKTEHALTLLAKACPELGLSFPDDSIQGHTLATHPCVSGELVRALGWWAYPKARHQCIDLYLTNIAYDSGGCAYLGQVQFYHKHHSVGRSVKDAVYFKAEWEKPEDIKASEEWRLGDEEKARERVRVYANKHQR